MLPPVALQVLSPRMRSAIREGGTMSRVKANSSLPVGIPRVQDWYCIWLLVVLVIPSLTVIRDLPPGTPVSLSFKPLGYLVSLSVHTHTELN